MKKKYDIEDLDCANCAARLEKALNEIPGITRAGVNFLTAKVTLEAPDETFEQILLNAKEVAKKTLADAKVNW